MIKRIIKGDITKLPDVDVIVNAAKSSLLGGGGVDRAIHSAAGPELLEACKQYKGCAVGHTKVTDAFELPNRAIFHTVGPVYHDGRCGEEDALASCYINTLAECIRHRFKTIAFPCISTGIYGFPKQRAAEIAVSICQLGMFQGVDITICCFEQEDFDNYCKLIPVVV